MFAREGSGGEQVHHSIEGGTVAVVVNYRTADKTIAAVRSLQLSAPPPSAIIVVDNGSGDGSSSKISADVSGIGLIERPVNGGFSAGCNAGVCEALRRGAARVFLLNSDALVSPAALGEMECLLESDARLGVVGPMIVSKTQPTEIESFGISFSRTTGRMWNQKAGRLPSGITPERCDVDAVSGCAMLVRREVFERVGLFDENYFFGFEDIDFCLRARTAGFRSAVVSALVEHEGHASIGRASATRMYFATRNHLLLAHRCSGSQSIPGRWFQTMSILGLNFAHALRSSEVSRLGSLRAFVLGARDHFAGQYGRKQTAEDSADLRP